MKILMPTQTMVSDKSIASAQPTQTEDGSIPTVFSLLDGQSLLSQESSEQESNTDESTELMTMDSVRDTTSIDAELTINAAIDVKTIDINSTEIDVSQTNTTDINASDIEPLSIIDNETLQAELAHSDAQANGSVGLDLPNTSAISSVDEQAKIDLRNGGSANVSSANISANNAQQASIAPTNDELLNQDNLRAPVTIVVPKAQDNGGQSEQKKRENVLSTTSNPAHSLSQSSELSATSSKPLMHSDPSLVNANREPIGVVQPIKVVTSSGQAGADAAVPSDNTAFRTLMNSVTANSDSVSQWKADSLGANPVQWGHKLLNMLTDKVQLQVGQHLQKAQIRLDPPNLGTIDISISVENERTTVNLVASHQQVRDAISQTLDQLRQNLGTKLNTEVTVSSQADTSGQGHSRQSSRFQENMIAGQWHDANNESASSTQQNSEWLNRLV